MSKLSRFVRNNMFARHKQILQLRESIEQIQGALRDLCVFSTTLDTFNKLKLMLANAYVPKQYYGIFYDMLRCDSAALAQLAQNDFYDSFVTPAFCPPPRKI